MYFLFLAAIQASRSAILDGYFPPIVKQRAEFLTLNNGLHLPNECNIFQLYLV